MADCPNCEVLKKKNEEYRKALEQISVFGDSKEYRAKAAARAALGGK